jgi:hypothetical protein
MKSSQANFHTNEKEDEAGDGIGEQRTQPAQQARKNRLAQAGEQGHSRQQRHPARLDSQQ